MVYVYEFTTKIHKRCDKYCYFMRGGNDRIRKINKIVTKYRWEILYVILLFTLVGINYSEPILHMSKRMVHIYSIYDIINQFEIGYMINPALNVNKVLREKVVKCLSDTYNENTMENIRGCLKKKNICVIALIMFNENNGVKPKKCIWC